MSSLKNWAGWLEGASQSEALPGIRFVQRELTAVLQNNEKTERYAARLHGETPIQFAKHVQLFERRPEVRRQIDSHFEHGLAAYLDVQTAKATKKSLDLQALEQAFGYFNALLASLSSEMEDLADMSSLSLSDLESALVRIEGRKDTVGDISQIHRYILVPAIEDNIDDVSDRIFEFNQQIEETLGSLNTAMDSKSAEIDDQLPIIRSREKEETQLATACALAKQVREDLAKEVECVKQSLSELRQQIPDMTRPDSLQNITASEFRNSYVRIQQLARRFMTVVNSALTLWDDHYPTFIHNPIINPYLIERTGSKEETQAVKNLRDDLSEFMKVKERLSELLQAGQSQLGQGFQRLNEIEPHVKPSSDLVLPQQPQLDQHFQIDASTPPDTLQKLSRLTIPSQDKLLEYPEVAFLAPDHEVYQRFATILELQERYEKKGYYFQYLNDSGNPQSAYAENISNRENITLILNDGTEITIKNIQCLEALPLSIMTSGVWEEYLNGPELYDILKLGYFFSFIINARLMPMHKGSDDSINSSLKLIFDGVKARLGVVANSFTRYADNINLYNAARDAILGTILLSQGLMKLLTKRVLSVTSLEQIRRRLRLLSKSPYKRWKHLGVLHSAKYRDVFSYIYAFKEIRAAVSLQEREQMLNELRGPTLQDVGLDMSMSGSVNEAMREWHQAAGESSPNEWLQYVQGWRQQARVFSTPSGSYLVSDSASLQRLVNYVQDPARRGPIKIRDDMIGELEVPAGLRGIRLDPVSEFPSGSLAHAFFERLELLGKSPSPVLDLVSEISQDRSSPDHDERWRQIVGLLMKLPNETVNDDILRGRLEKWAVLKRDLLILSPTLFDTVDRVEQSISGYAHDRLRDPMDDLPEDWHGQILISDGGAGGGFTVRLEADSHPSLTRLMEYIMNEKATF